jgi:hypothetical protein
MRCTLRVAGGGGDGDGVVVDAGDPAINGSPLLQKLRLQDWLRCRGGRSRQPRKVQRWYSNCTGRIPHPLRAHTTRARKGQSSPNPSRMPALWATLCYSDS